MENILLIVHLVLAVFLIAVVLLQRSEGGALGIGGGGGGLVSQRGAATALGKVTWLLAIGFICTSIGLTMLSGGRQGSIFETQPVVNEQGEEIDPLLLQTPAPTADGDVPLPSAPSDQ